MAEPYRYVGGLLRNDASARARDKGGRTFVRQGENWRSDNCRVVFEGGCGASARDLWAGDRYHWWDKTV